PNEMAATSVLEVLDLAGIPLHADRRTVSDPLVIGGGPCAFNPEPLAPFFDAFFIGEGENAIIEIVEVVRQTKAKGFAREQQLAALSALEGIYVPSLYDKSSADPIKKRIARDFATIAGPNDRIVPFVDVVHDRCSIEILRGCNRGCRFCQAGMTYRPARERSADTIIRAALKGVERTGYDEVSLTSLSSTDHSQITEIVRRLNAALAPKGVSVSLPSLRVDSFSIDLMNVLTSGSKRPALTLAPEAGTQRMRDIINKNVTEEQVLDMVRSAFEVGYLRVKLYFMIGLPHETDEDIVGIAQLVQKVSEVAHDSVEPKKRGAVKVALSVSSFVPKAHTPFQWAQQDSVAEIERKQDMLKAALPRKGVQLSYHDAHTSHIEGLIARGDATLAPVIEAAWRAGARFEAYAEQFDYALWQQAFEATGFDPDHNAEPRKPGEPLAWDHISTGVSTEYLMQEAQNAQKAKLTLDCTFKSCTTCGVCQNLGTTIDIKADRG
ncbi:MAG: TIGR03960 family B12-binding radical SAM protein, partial [Actinomycetia bacterium]|nr:TIGR03960 family B12-binding radical SAM protein [Actinomycetes bacterium]